MFLYCLKTNKPVQIYKYHCHVFGAKNSPISHIKLSSASDNKEMYPITVKGVKINFYMEDFIKSLETSEEAFEVINQQKPFLSKQGFESTKWMSNNDAVIVAIAENLKSISNTNQVDVELNMGDLQCLDYNGLLLIITFKYAEVPTTKLKHL